MFVEFVSKEVINGVSRLVNVIRYSNGKRTKRVFNEKLEHIDSIPLPPFDEYYGGLLNQGAYSKK